MSNHALPTYALPPNTPWPLSLCSHSRVKLPLLHARRTTHVHHVCMPLPLPAPPRFSPPAQPPLSFQFPPPAHLDCPACRTTCPPFPSSPTCSANPTPSLRLNLPPRTKTSKCRQKSRAQLTTYCRVWRRSELASRTNFFFNCFFLKILKPKSYPTLLLQHRPPVPARLEYATRPSRAKIDHSIASLMSSPTPPFPNDAAPPADVLAPVSHLQTFAANITAELDDAEASLSDATNQPFAAMSPRIMSDVAQLRNAQFDMFRRHVEIEQSYNIENAAVADANDVQRMTFSAIAKTMRKKERATAGLLDRLAQFDTQLRNVIDKFDPPPSTSPAATSTTPSTQPVKLQ